MVQAALGQLVQLFCPEDGSPDPHSRWQKDGRPVSSDRWVQPAPLPSPSDSRGWEGERAGGSPSSGSQAHCCLRTQRSSPLPALRHQLQSDGSLVISPLRAEDAGTYSCGGPGPDRHSQQVQLHVTGLIPTPPNPPVGSSGPQGGGPSQGAPTLGD